jgi:UDP-N-acetylmuramoyl-tripeptide--D-alanyl-D-alanine ligase
MDIKTLHSLFLRSSGVSTDTRKITDGSIFFALKGGNFNGNVYAQEALEIGASFAVIDEPVNDCDPRLILFPDALKALQDLSKHHRRQFKIPLIGITGSNGKTTTKELIRDVLTSQYKVLATKGNLNNHIGVPLTLLELSSETEIAIIEMGANHLKEIEFLCSLSEPDYGMITNIGTAHVGEFGSPENILLAKTELFSSIKKSKGTLFVDLESEVLMEKSQDIDRITYGSNSNSNYQVELSSADPSLEVRWKGRNIKTHLIGSYNLANVSAAIAIGAHFKVSEEGISKALSSYTPENNRSQLLDKGHYKLILDAYNANPSSMKAAFQNFIEMKAKKHYFILGEMKELGEGSIAYHKEIIAMVSRTVAEGIFIGPDFCIAAADSDAICFQDVLSAQEFVSKLDLDGSLVLLKGSRGTRLELLQEVL